GADAYGSDGGGCGAWYSLSGVAALAVIPAVRALINAGLIVSKTCRPIAPRKPVRPLEKSLAPPSSPDSTLPSRAAREERCWGISAFSILANRRSACSSLDGTNAAAAANPAMVAPATIAQ